jgi:histidine racemase
MKLRFVKCNPTENMTILVIDPVPADLRSVLAVRLMAENHLHAEQVGFFEQKTQGGKETSLQLHMMGGEFCANATRSLAAVLAMKGHPGEKGKSDGIIYRIFVSGVDDPVTCEVFPGEEAGVYRSEINHPMPNSIEPIVLLYKETKILGTLVSFPGISHLVINQSIIDEKEEFFHVLRTHQSDRQDDALGMMFFDEVKSFLEPLVWVRGTDTLLWERGCGSGTAAVGVALASQHKKSLRREISQPGGKLIIDVVWQTGVKSIMLSGEIQIVAEGTAYLSQDFKD